MRSYRTVDKSEWPAGPWQEEDDKIQWVDEATDLDCLIVRSHMGSLCGYVGVPSEHPWHGRSYYDGDPWDDSIACKVDVHGGLTYADSCDEDAPEGSGICHVPEPGRTGDVWWFGFDAGHAWDRRPGMEYSPEFQAILGAHETYKDVEYMKDQCRKLAAQLMHA